MIEMEPYGIEPPSEVIQTDVIPKPEPESTELDIWECHKVLGPFEKGVLFSGGDDSLVLTHLAMKEGWAKCVVHLDTNSAVPENLDYVRSVCKKFHWPLIVISSPMELATFAYRYGFPGVSCHTSAFQYFKGRQLSFLHKKTNNNLKLLSGVRTAESDRRMRNIDAEVEYSSTDSGNFEGWWISPLIDKSDSWMENYREEHNLPRNPAAEKLHRSPDCQCMSFGHRDEELTLLQAEYPEFADWLLNVERRVQEYRGRVELLEEQYPDVYTKVSNLREQTRPYPMRLTVLKDKFPDVFDTIVSINREEAIRVGRLDETNYIGHGGLSSKELREKIASADGKQMTLCETCSKPAENVAASVKRRQEEAKESLKDTSLQTELPSV